MEATVLSVGKSAVSGALDYAKSAIAQEVALQLGVWRDQVFITDELEMMQGFLRAAHDERDGNMVVKIWVKQVRDVAYDAEDCLMDFAVRLEMQSCWRIPCMLPDRHRVAMEMKELRARVEDVSRRNMRYSLIRGSATSKPGTVAGQSSISSEVLLHIAQATRTAQQQEEKVDLSKLLTNDYDGLRVIAVLGKSSAVGVTSIIRDAYDKCDQFQCRAWVRLIHPFNPHDLFVSLVRQFYKDSCERSGKSIGVKNTGVEVYKKMLEQEGNLVDEFNRYVTEKRYLVVITDVSTIEEWDWVKTYFPSMNGSRIIVSTQQFEVASLCTEQPCTVSEIDQKWSFDKDFYVFYNKVDDKAESSSKAKSTNAEPASKETGNSTHDSVVAAALEDEQLIDRKNAKDLELIDHSFGEVGDPSKMNDISEPRSNAETGDAELASKEHADKSTKELARATFEDDQLIDRKKAKADVLKLLKQDGEVIVICGMGGIGKTTLVRSVYQQELGQRFQRQAWLTISHSFNHKEFLVDLFQQLCRDDNDKEGKAATTIKEKFFSKTSKENKSKEEEEEIDKKLLNILSKKTCLVVLDDLSFSKDWKLIGDTLLPSDRNPDNRIIVTTRDAKCCPVDTRQIYNLNELNDDDSLELFEKKVFKDQKERVNYDNNRDMVEQAKLILNKCGGLPLVVSTIGSFLATKPKTAMEWRNLNKHISTELQVNPELEMINTILVSSYEGLPYHLKLPFLYFSIFPEDRNIRWARLVRRWIAEGYSKEVRDKRAEEIGNSYITDLINRSMIRPSKGTGRRITRRIGFLQIHDLIREITISKSTEENLVFTLHEGCRLNTQEGKVRHLAVSNSWLRDKNAFESAAGNWSHVRSLTVFGEWKSFFISDNMRLLRVLDLEDTEGLENHHLHLIVKLFHLKYLSLRRCGRLLRLPDSLGNLRHLETLDVRDTQIIKMPSTIIKLRKLQYLHVGFIPSYDRKEERGRYRLDLGSLFCCPWECWCCCWPVCLVFSLLGVLLTMLVLLGLAAWVLMKDGFDGLRAEFMGVVIRGVKFPRGIRELKALRTMGVVNIDGGVLSILMGIMPSLKISDILLICAS